jgi:hypothetical protein
MLPKSKQSAHVLSAILTSKWPVVKERKKERKKQGKKQRNKERKKEKNKQTKKEI